ncbi:MAG: DUF1501 domain-containing protein [Planctomycetota bacterium]|nr:DUF1501 domain-containing protein [Planctomycetota bacterium]
MCKRKRHLPKSVSRRDILRYTLAGAGIAALGPLGRGMIPTASGAPLANHKRIVSIFCYGGYDGLNLLVPVTNNAYYNRRSTIAIQPGNALDIGDPDYKLHPSMTRMAALFNAGQAAAFRMVGYPDRNLSHFISQDIHSWGVRYDFNSLGISESGWIARYADNYATTPMGAASLGLGRPLEFEGGSTNPFLAGSLSSFNFSRSSISSNDHQHRLAALGDVLQSFSGDTLTTEAKTALDQGIVLTDQIQTAVAEYLDDVTGSPFKDTYPVNSRGSLTTPGRYMRDAAMLIRGGFETEIFMTGFGGWDTHGNQGNETGNQANLIARMDGAIGAFVDDCIDMGVWNDTLILISSEFGRRNFQNGSDGTDHGHGNMFFALGGALNGGIYGPPVTESDVADNNWLGYGLDYRDIFKEAVANHMGENAATVFPESQDINTTLNYV